MEQPSGASGGDVRPNLGRKTLTRQNFQCTRSASRCVAGTESRLTRNRYLALAGGGRLFLHRSQAGEFKSKVTAAGFPKRANSNNVFAPFSNSGK